MSKVKDSLNSDGSLYRHLFMCPGCKEHHGVDDTWQFNGDYERPTFSPSVLVEWTEGANHEQRRCHSFVKEGKIEFLGDCTHALAGQMVELPQVQKGLL